MAEIVITIRDEEEGKASVAWKTDTESQYLSEEGTDAERIALYVLMILAKASGNDIAVKPAGEGNN